MFQDQEFVDACSELETSHVDGWEFFTDSHDVRIYRLYNDVSHSRVLSCMLFYA